MGDVVELHKWEVVIDTAVDGYVERMRIPGGWLYRVDTLLIDEAGQAKVQSHVVYAPLDTYSGHI
jgi:hypothetical protein